MLELLDELQDIDAREDGTSSESENALAASSVASPGRAMFVILATARQMGKCYDEWR